MKRKFAIRAFLRSELDDPNRRVSDLPRASTKSLTSVLYLETSLAGPVCWSAAVLFTLSCEGPPLFRLQQQYTCPKPKGFGHPHEIKVTISAASIRRIQLPVRPARFPLNPHHPIKVHAFRLQPSLQRLPSFRAKFHKHFSFQHVDEHAFRPRRSSRLHPLRKVFRTLPRQACKRVLRKIARHESSKVNLSL